MSNATPSLTDRIDAMLAGIREDGARRRKLQDPTRANPMVARAMGGDAATIAELRAVTGELAREVVALKAALAAAQTVHPWHVVRGIEHMPGGTGVDYALITLRGGMVLEVGDEGVNAFRDFDAWTQHGEPFASVLFITPKGGA